MSDVIAYTGAWVVIIGGFLLGIFLFIAMIFWFGNMLATPSSLLEIEQLRLAAGRIDLDASEDIAGQVVDTNQSIVSTQYWNGVWWWGWTIPDEWDDVELIEVPE